MKLDNKINVNAKEQESQILNYVRGVAEDYSQAPYLLAIAAYFAKISNNKNFYFNAEKYCKDGSACQFLEEYILTNNGYIDAVKRLASSFDENELKEFILDFNPDAYSGKNDSVKITGASLNNLATRLLDIHEKDQVGDIGSGIGSFLVAAASVKPEAKYCGVEISESARNVSILRLAVAGVDADIANANAFEVGLPESCDKVFSNFPFGMRAASKRDYGKYYDLVINKLSKAGRLSSLDWLFNMLAFDSLAPNGKAVTMTTNGATFNENDKQARKYFIDNGMIQTIVALPEKLVPGTAIPVTLFVLGENQGNIRMVDATDLYVEERRQNIMDDECIDELVQRISFDGDKSKLVGKKEISEKDYVLYPNRYMQRELHIINPTRLGDLVVSVSRSAGFRAAELDKMVTDEDTRISYLQLADIKDGRIARNLHNLVHLDDGMERFVIENGDLLISKNGSPFKVAVAEIPEQETVISNGNLYIVKLNQNEVNPYYLAAFFASEDGKTALNGMVVGSTIPNLPITNLKDIEVPLLDMELQTAIAQNYQAALDEIEVYKVKAEKARVAMAEAYSTGVEFCQH